MSCDVAALPFQAHANYETWSIDFGTNNTKAVCLYGKSSWESNILLICPYTPFVLLIYIFKNGSSSASHKKNYKTWKLKVLFMFNNFLFLKYFLFV